MVELDIIIPCDSECLPVCGEGVVCDWVVEQMMNLGGCHTERFSGRSGSLLPRILPSSSADESGVYGESMERST